MHNCLNCQFLLEDGTTCCPRCGYHCLGEVYLVAPVCPTCKKKFPSGTRFCDIDGSKLTTEDQLIPKCTVRGKESPSEITVGPARGDLAIAEIYQPPSAYLQPNSTASANLLEVEFKSLMVDKVNKEFKWFTWLYVGILFGAFVKPGTVITVLGNLVGQSLLNENWLWVLLASLEICLVVIMQIIALIMQYQAWSLIQSINPRTTPGKAVGFQFIPFFNLYWFFVAFNGLAKDVNTFISLKNLKVPKMNEVLGLILAILISTLSILKEVIKELDPNLLMTTGGLVGAKGLAIVFFIVYFIFMKGLKTSMVSIMEQQAV